MQSSHPSINETRRPASGISFSAGSWIPAAVIAALAVPLMLWLWKGPISPRGGLPIPGVIMIGVPQFFQSDPRWGREALGNTRGTLGSEGCAVTSAAMVLRFYGMDVDPGRLNRFLGENQGYEGRGWLRWESAAEFTSGQIEKAYEDLPSHARIDWNLLSGNPVIVRIRRPDGITHFVVIVGKRGFEYLIRDPAGHGSETGGAPRALGDLGVPVEALRYYRRIR